MRRRGDTETDRERLSCMVVKNFFISTAFCLLPPASCLLPPASCLLPSKH
ncbi:MAG: hypothetical protein F6K41_32995 [Symploca sp. SIO3E6]|nr:hypothetical protein [Caldora sp. SIO3E6]